MLSLFLLEVTNISFTISESFYKEMVRSSNEFLFLLDDELGHVWAWIAKYLKGKNDKVEQFRGMDKLYEKI